VPDPSKNRREDLLRDIRGRFRRIRGLVREWVGYERDVFGLRQDGSEPPVPGDTGDDAPDVYRFKSDAENIAAFTEWLDEQVREGVLVPVGTRAVKAGEHWTAAHIRASYGQGWQQARSRLRTAGVSVGEDLAVDAVFDLPVPTRTLARLYTRTFENLASVSADVAPTVRDTLTRTLAEGKNPREAARELTGEIRELERTQADVLARTEIVNAYSDATIDRYKRAGVSAVEHGEFSDADDSRVCPICESLDGREIPMSEIRTATFTFEPDEHEPDSLAGEYGLKPPIHPQGRCVLNPVID
jgi:SPP1 gp7 family putative phage head morphogenesis protein